ncbi:hypothetical protein E4U54_003554 [Claviceps lovelessii]|nr:hypothetical protein E4U54_003554 [Claviceps lovelessii]
MSVNARIDSWRHSVPSRLDREDPFENDGFGGRCGSRFTFRDDHPSVLPKQTSRLSSLRSRISCRRKRSRNADHLIMNAPSVNTQERYSVFGPLAYSREGGSPAPGPAPEPGPCGKRSKAVLFTKGIFGRKRARSPTPPSPPPPALLIQEPVKLKFLFVGDHGSGQTALLYRTAFGYFPDHPVRQTTAIVKTTYETYTLDKPHLPAQMEL